MLWGNLLIFSIGVLFIIIGFIATKYTYLYAKEEGYEYDFTPFFMFSAYGKYRNMAFIKTEKDSYYREKAKLYNIYAVICFVAMFIVECILKLLGYI